MTTLTDAARSHGYDALVPERIEELSRTHRVQSPRAIGLEIPADAHSTDTLSIEEITSALVRPLHCSALYEEPGPGPTYWQRESSLYLTLLHTADIKADPHQFPEPARILTPKEAQGIKNDYAACRLESA
ncbi:hypothetical protein [Streptomyces sp. NPDC002463]|uniref:hypothetical protein n=1 Tax=Streptomyces sp. NPDC002463 TaxID=3364645 RepID=UPI0036A441CB